MEPYLMKVTCEEPARHRDPPPEEVPGTAGRTLRERDIENLRFTKPGWRDRMRANYRCTLGLTACEQSRARQKRPADDGPCKGRC